MSCDLAIIRAINYSIMKLDEMRAEIISLKIEPICCYGIGGQRMLNIADCRTFPNL
jgi:hypothetical protein